MQGKCRRSSLFNRFRRNTINSNQVTHLLQGSPLFQKVKSSTIASMLMKTTRVKLEAGEILLTPGQRNEHLYLVLSGRMRAQINADDTKPLALFGIGESVGEMSMLDDSPVSAYVIAITDCELLSIEHQEVWSVLNRSIQASHNMLAMMAGRIRSSNRRLAESAANAQSYGALNYVNNVTGMYNSKWLSVNIGRMIRRHDMNQQPSALLLLKVENFGMFDSGFGTAGSEQAQHTIAETIARFLRPDDIAVHLEADRFAVFLSQTQAQDAQSVADRLHETLHQMVIGSPSGDAMPPLMLSVGVGRSQLNDTLESLLARITLSMQTTSS